MVVPESFKLNNGLEIPSVLYGSYKSDGDNGVDSMIYAFDEAGYRGVDTALFYNNHDFVKEALKRSKTPREQLIVQTKIWPTQMRDVEKWTDVAIKELGTYIDILFIHWPFPLVDGEDKKLDEDWDFVKTWKLMEKLPKDKVRAIGVCNFRIEDLEKLIKESDTVPVINQCEFHPSLPQQELVDYCLKHKIVPQAYRPLGRGKVDHPTLQEIAKKHNVDAGQIALSWNVQRGVSVLPKSTTPSRIVSNHKLIQLDPEDLAKITELGPTNNRTCFSKPIYGFEYFD